MKRMLLVSAACACVLVTAAYFICNHEVDKPCPGLSGRLLIGRYSDLGEHALGVYDFNDEDASARHLFDMPVENASFLDVGDEGVVYVVSESGDASKITALRLDPDSLGARIVNSRPVDYADPCYVKVSPDGRFVITANYTGGTVSIYPVASDGSIGALAQTLEFDFENRGAIPSRQEAPHPHCISFTPDGEWMLVNDLGSDAIHQYRVLADSGVLVNPKPDKEVAIEPGSGPRHIVFNREGNRAYLINELSDKVAVLGYEHGVLEPLQYIAADTAGAGAAADIHLSPDGRHLYASLRLKHDGIAQFDVDAETGLLTYVGHTETAVHPRNFAITPDGLTMFVACRDGNIVERYSINPEDGTLAQSDHSIPASKAVFVRFLPAVGR